MNIVNIDYIKSYDDILLFKKSLDNDEYLIHENNLISLEILPNDFNIEIYIKLNDDLKIFNSDQMKLHFLRFGKEEKRIYIEYLENIILSNIKIFTINNNIPNIIRNITHIDIQEQSNYIKKILSNIKYYNDECILINNLNVNFNYIKNYSRTLSNIIKNNNKYDIIELTNIVFDINNNEDIIELNNNYNFDCYYISINGIKKIINNNNNILENLNIGRLVKPLFGYNNNNSEWDKYYNITSLWDKYYSISNSNIISNCNKLNVNNNIILFDNFNPTELKLNKYSVLINNNISIDDNYYNVLSYLFNKYDNIDIIFLGYLNIIDNNYDLFDNYEKYFILKSKKILNNNHNNFIILINNNILSQLNKLSINIFKFLCDVSHNENYNYNCVYVIRDYNNIPLIEIKNYENDYDSIFNKTKVIKKDEYDNSTEVLDVFCSNTEIINDNIEEINMLRNNFINSIGIDNENINTAENIDTEENILIYNTDQYKQLEKLSLYYLKIAFISKKIENNDILRFFISNNTNKYYDNILSYITSSFDRYIISKIYDDTIDIYFYCIYDNDDIIYKKCLNICISSKIKYHVNADIGYVSIKKFRNPYNIYIPQLFYNSDNKYLINNKSMFCAYMYNNDIPYRLNIFNIISKYKKIDVLSKSCNVNNDEILILDNDTIIKKYSNYKFILSLESNIIDGYITDKLMNALFSGSIPIYAGPKDVFDIINKDRIIYIYDFKNFNDLLQYIIILDTNDILYNKIVERPVYNTSSIINYNKLEEYIQINTRSSFDYINIINNIRPILYSKYINNKINYINHIIWINNNNTEYMNLILKNINIPNTKFDMLLDIRENIGKINLDINDELIKLLTTIKAINSLKEIIGSYFMVCYDNISFDNIFMIKTDLQDIIKKAPDFDILILNKNLNSNKVDDEYSKFNNQNINSLSYIISRNGINKICNMISFENNKFIFNIIALGEVNKFIFNNLNTYIYKYNYINSYNDISYDELETLRNYIL